MEAYEPTSSLTVGIVFLFLAAALLLGFTITRFSSRLTARILSWLLVTGGLIALERYCAPEPAGFRMLALITYGLFAMKAVVMSEARGEGMSPLPIGRWLAFSAGWFGMRPQLFDRSTSSTQQGAKELFVKGIVRLLLGGILTGLAFWAWDLFHSRILATIFLLSGLSLILHFGLFNIVAAAWRTLGFDCRSLFRDPLRSQNLSEFWGKRWNLAFNEMTSIAVYRPLSKITGKQTALVSAFLFSGLLHEMAISLPVMAGFGLPFLYFLLHGGAMLVERRLARRGTPIQGWKGRLWTFAWLVIPLPILFHPPFLSGVVWPLIGID